MRRYVYLASLCLACLVLLLGLTYLVDVVIEIPKISLSTLANLTEVVASIGTLVVALLLYRRFNGSQTLVDEQTKEVMRMLRFIADLRIFTERYDNGSFVSLNANIRVMNFRHRFSEEHVLVTSKGEKLAQYADTSVLEMTTKLNDFIFEHYLPKSVAEVLKAHFLFGTARAEETAKVPTQYVKVSVRGNFEAPKSVNVTEAAADGYSELLVEIDKQRFDVEILLGYVEQVYDAGVAWLKKNNPDLYGSLNIGATKSKDFF